MLSIAPFRQRDLGHKIVGKAEIEDVGSVGVRVPGIVGRGKGVGKHVGGTGVRGQSVGQQIGDRRAAAVAGDQIYRVADVVFFSFILIFLGNFVYKSRCISFTKKRGILHHGGVLQYPPEHGCVVWIVPDMEKELAGSSPAAYFASL